MKRSMFLVFLATFLFISIAVPLQAAVTVEGPFLDEVTQGNWPKTYGNGDYKNGACFFLLPQPRKVGYIEWPLETDLSNVCYGGSFVTSGRLVEWDIFKAGADPTPFLFWFDPADQGLQTRPSGSVFAADQWNPCMWNYHGATFDNDLSNYDPLAAKLVVNHRGSLRVAFYFLEELVNCRSLEYQLTVNGVVKSTGSVSHFDVGKYAVFRVHGLEGTSTIQLDVYNPTPGVRHPNCPSDEIPGINVHLSGVFVDQCEQGCTPGYWKQSQHFDSWVGYSPSMKFSSVFGKIITIRWSSRGKPVAVKDPTLLQALEANGGDVNALARHAVAALLNAANGHLTYPRTVEQVMNMVKTAISSGKYEDTKNTLAGWNEIYCPLN